ncbi:MAG: hypothetical protein J2P51_13975, partial [Hyphomicrobiaceae bacterium]|nr:hypothetical protein [Hyphomicrobiaceae bacterium]
MDLHDQRIACLRMAIKMGCTPDTAIQVAMDLMGFVDSGIIPSPSKATTPDPVGACGTVLAPPAAAELAATPTPQAASEPQAQAPDAAPVAAVAARSPHEGGAAMVIGVAAATAVPPSLEPALSAAAPGATGVEAPAADAALAPQSVAPEMASPDVAPVTAALDVAGPDVRAAAPAVNPEERPETSAASAPFANLPSSRVAERAPAEE